MTDGGGRPKGRWRAWRRSRPFWGGLLVALGGIEMLVTLRAPLPVILKIGPQGLAGYLVPVVLLLCGVLLLTHPPQRVFYALVSMVLALVSWLTSNLGGFVIGMLLALVGACLAFAWTPVKAPRGAARPAGPAEPDDPAAGGPAALTGPPPALARPGPAPAQPGPAPAQPGPAPAQPEPPHARPEPLPAQPGPSTSAQPGSPDAAEPTPAADGRHRRAADRT
ncbi:DUF6114 domain-containing protein [Micromonospora okii]|uniref:DUF6114 domain-containing protein n=1 Tax=Micromonospora okii TaxID=1182970 RepID=UPI001E35DFDC|nr:DUF6114 domain-containing protein [Micromonospora okii]